MHVSSSASLPPNFFYYFPTCSYPTFLILYFLFSEAPSSLLQKQTGVDLSWKELSQDDIVLLPGEKKRGKIERRK